VGECTDFKFGGHVSHSKSQLTDNKPFLKGAWSHHMSQYKFFIHLKYVLKFGKHVGCIKLVVFG